MTAPLSALVQAATETVTKTPLQEDRETALQECKNLFSNVGQFVESQALKAAKHGAIAFADGWEHAKNYSTLMGMLRDIYPALSDVPFPEFPSEKVTPIVAEEVVE